MNIKEYLDSTGKTQSKFAQEVGISQGMVSMYVNGIKYPSPRTANVINDVSGGKITYVDIYANIAEKKKA